MEKHEDLPAFVCDDLHFDCKECDGYNKTWNYIVCEREAGKSTLMWKKIYNAYRNEGRPSIVLRRHIVDVTDQYIEDTATLLNKFTGGSIEFEYRKQDIKNGQMDVKIKGHDCIFFRIIALSSPMSRLKSMVVRGVKFMMMDEFICNLRLGEKYLSDEPFRVKELYTTYNRETVEMFPGKPIKIFLFGNPYSLFNPYFSSHNVNTNKIYPGVIIADQNYCIQCYQIKPELKEKILKNNPMYQFDESYKKYAFDGRAIHDSTIRIREVQPLGFRLMYTMKLHDKVLGIYRGYEFEEQLWYWCKVLNPEEIATWRQILCFEFGQMSEQTVLMNNNQKKQLYNLKDAIQRRWIAFETIEASYFMEEIYQQL